MSIASFLVNNFSLEGRVGIVTGATRGLGNAISLALVSSGAKVYGLYSSQLSPENESQSDKITFIKSDITNYGLIQETINNIISKENSLDFLVNNAGISYKDNAHTFSQEQWQKIHNVNVHAVFNLCQQVFPYLSKSQFIGKIVNITSMAAHLGFEGVAPYCSSKAAVLGLTRALAVEWAKNNMRINSVAPGWIHTAMTDQVSDPARIQKILNRMPLHQFGKETDIAMAVLYLISNAGNYVHGIDLPVDGGALSYGY